MTAEPRALWPPEWGLVVVVLLAAAGIVALGAQLWIWGILLFLAAGAAWLAQREVERRSAGAALAAAWARVAARREVVSARSRSKVDLFRLRRELAELHAERNRTFYELGRATYERDHSAARAARARAAELSKRIAETDAEAAALLRQLEEHVGDIRAQAAPTRQLESPPEPVRVPEPWPPPDEGSPPEPARIPEPSPQPVPERSPADPPGTPEHPPTPQEKRRTVSRARNG
ncbi:MAG TPA: hypothetical protein VK915_11450 [Gaiellaceae bacterium]|nr:hypothetical protein [Gaiellaceae bacterium]